MNLRPLNIWKKKKSNTGYGGGKKYKVFMGTVLVGWQYGSSIEEAQFWADIYFNSMDMKVRVEK